MLALKYRPKNFDELIGQEAVRKSLSYALANAKVAQAYLFSGLRGSGKTSSARILARCLNCAQGVREKPCGVCANCTSSSDIYELDAASNRGIDAINELIESTKYGPIASQFKIYIIDEVHMLTKEAFNALLKTLEEPPSYIKFILATTDPNKLPATILSRVLHFRFKKIPASLVAEHLGRICACEGIAAEPAALEMIARAGGGSMRDALTLLDQSLLYCGGALAAAGVASMLGVFDAASVRELLRAVAAGDEAGVGDFLARAREYEAAAVIEAIKDELKSDFFGAERLFDLASYERMFGVLSRAMALGKSCEDDEFALNLCVLQLCEAAFCGDLSAAGAVGGAGMAGAGMAGASGAGVAAVGGAGAVGANSANAGGADASGLFSELIRRSCERDADFGQLLAAQGRLDGLDEQTAYICFNPQNAQQAEQFRRAYASWWYELASKLFGRALKITSETAAQAKAAANSAPAATTGVAKSADKPAAPAEKPAHPAAQTPPAPKPAADFGEPTVEPVAKIQRAEPELPSYQLDEFDGTLEDDEQLGALDIAASEEAFEGMSEAQVDAILTYACVEMQGAEPVIVVAPPAAEPELSALRAAVLAYRARLAQLFGREIAVQTAKKKLN